MADPTLATLLGPQHHPLQPAMILAKEFEVAVVAGFGAGKTYALCVAALRHALRFPNARVVLGRVVEEDMIRSIKRTFFENLVDAKELRGYFAKPATWAYQETSHRCVLTNGAEILFSNFEPKLTKHKNVEYTMVGVDQAEDLDWEIALMLLQRCRFPGVPSSERKVYWLANDEGDNWIRRRFLTFEAPHGRPSKDAPRKLIRGSSLQNPHLDLGAKAQLLAMPAELQARYVYARMDAGASRLLPNLTQIPLTEPIPWHWPVWVGIDPARSSGTTAALWVTVNPDLEPWRGIPPNTPVFFDEYGGTGRDPEDHAEAILRQSEYRPGVQYIMDQKAWENAVRSRRLGSVTVADLYIRAGLPVTPSQGDPWTRILFYVQAARRGLCAVAGKTPQLAYQMPRYQLRGQEATTPDGSAAQKIKSKATFHWVDAGGYGLSHLPTRAAKVDLRSLVLPFTIAPKSDPHSRAFWERQRAQLMPAGAMGRRRPVGDGFDLAAFHEDARSSPAPSMVGVEGPDWW